MMIPQREVVKGEKVGPGAVIPVLFWGAGKHGIMDDHGITVPE
jgi:hypothetical protein